MTKIVTIGIGFAVALIMSIIFWQLWPSFKYEVLPKQVALRGERFTLQVAVTEKEREKGLGGRETLCQTCAMLFMFEKPGQHAFWMKNMRFPIDIVWLSRGRVVFVAREVSADFSGILDPAVSADQVIEFNAGMARNIDVGEEVHFFTK